MDDLPSWLPLLTAQLDRIEAHLAQQSLRPPDEMMTVQQAMAYLNYTNRTSFLRAVRTHRIPMVEINGRNFMFDVKALREWKERRTLYQSK